MRPNKDRSKRAIVFLWLFTGITLASIFAHIYQYLLITDIKSGQYNFAWIQSNLVVQSIFAIGASIVYLFAGIFFITWFRRAYFNLHTITNDLSFSEGWAAGSWFVPIMNWIRPYKIMKEMMTVTENALVQKNLISPAENRVKLVNQWWTLWIITSVVSYFNGQIQSKMDDLVVLEVCAFIDIALALTYIPLTMITVKMIRTYSEMENHLPSLERIDGSIRIDDTDLLDSI